MRKYEDSVLDALLLKQNIQMRFLNNLFGKGEDPLPLIEDPELGLLEWSKDEEAWTGTYGIFRVALTYEREPTPTQPLLVYAKKVLFDPGWLASTLEHEKSNWALKVPSNLKAEVAGLTFGTIQFSVHEEEGYIIADIEGGAGNRSWRIEYQNRECLGLGFDT